MEFHNEQSKTQMQHASPSEKGDIRARMLQAIRSAKMERGLRFTKLATLVN